MNKIVLLSFLFITGRSFAQTDSLSPKLTFSGYVEAYYTYDFGNPMDHNRPGFGHRHLHECKLCGRTRCAQKYL